jgi:hypothetical protein
MATKNLFIALFLTASLPAQAMEPELDKVLEDYRKTLPAYPKVGECLWRNGLERNTVCLPICG